MRICLMSTYEVLQYIHNYTTGEPESASLLEEQRSKSHSKAPGGYCAHNMGTRSFIS